LKKQQAWRLVVLRQPTGASVNNAQYDSDECVVNCLDTKFVGRSEGAKLPETPKEPDLRKA
jgi:hypothetical protein